MQMVLVPIACRSVGNKEDLISEEISGSMYGIWGAVRLVQDSPSLVKLLDMRTPEVIPI